MTDIFDNTILCKQCKQEMQKTIVNKNGFELRALKCDKCKSQIIHPADINGYEKFNNIKGKTYNVKLRVIGNSHAISIPKEIVNFMRYQEKTFNELDQMVRLCFEDFHKLSLRFNDPIKEDLDEDELDKKINSEKKFRRFR